MRSLTQASADTSIPIPPIPPATPPPSSSWSRPPPTTSCPIHQDTSTPLHIRPITSPTTQHSFFDIESDTLLLSLQSKRHVTRAIQNGWATSTVKRYSSSIKQYIRFCDSEGVPERLRFPADEFVLCAFAASSVGIHARSTPRNRISALKAWHVAHNLKWNGSPRLRYVLNGVHNLTPQGSRRSPRPPVTAKMLIQLIRRLDLNNPLDVAIAACAAMAFWGQCRLGELLRSSLLAVLSILFPLRSSVRRSRRNPRARVVRLPHTKTHQHGEDVVLVDQCEPINPISLLTRHLQINDIPHDAHLFSYTTPQGLRSLTKPLFLRRCNEIWQSLGYPRTTGHCFRIGRTTELLIAGTPPDVVKATGRWSSDSFMRYWRSLDDIAPLYICRLHTRKRAPRFR
jgi:hypothetical protein